MNEQAPNYELAQMAFTQTNEIAAALAKAQGAMDNAPLNKVNPHFKSKYADLAAIRDAVVPALTANGIAVVQSTEIIGEKLVLRTRLLHSSGQFIESVYPLPFMPDKPQVMGSALTYAKRYSLSSICGISADEDDDGNAAQKSDNKPVDKTPITNEQRDQILALCEETKSDVAAFCQYLGVEAVGNLPAYDFQRAVKALEKKRAA